MSKRQATAIIALLAVIAVALVAMFVYLVGFGNDTQQSEQAEGESATETSASAEPAGLDTEESIALLEGAGIDVVMAPPVPEAPERWGDYVLNDSWDGQVRVFEGSGVESIRGKDDGRFPATMNGCGSQMYFVTFRSVADPVQLEAQLINAVDEPVASEVLNNGWMLGTNCATPSFAFHSSDAEGNLTDVAYTVHEYRQSSVAQATPTTQAQSPAASQSAPPQTAAPQPAAPSEPTFVHCVPGLSSNAVYSDGSTRRDTRCPEQRALEAERVCGGLYGWQEVSRERYIELCGVEPPTG